jgi:hypothetical protein
VAPSKLDELEESAREARDERPVAWIDLTAVFKAIFSLFKKEDQ